MADARDHVGLDEGEDRIHRLFAECKTTHVGAGQVEGMVLHAMFDVDSTPDGVLLPEAESGGRNVGDGVLRLGVFEDRALGVAAGRGDEVGVGGHVGTRSQGCRQQ